MDVANLENQIKDQKFLKAVHLAKNAAVSKIPVLVIGEVGTGKKTLARYIHERSGRSTGPLLVVDCAQEAKDVENKILGHRDENNGRFVKGVLEQANGGTVVLTNIDAIEESFQKRLHTIINELPDYDIDVRIICTTTKNLSKLVGAGRFYRGLYTYLSATTMTIPPLRERPTDIKYLIDTFIFEQSEKRGESITISPQAQEKLMGHYWTHNVQELRAVIETTISNLKDNSLITEEDLEIGEKKAVSLMSDDDGEGIRLMSLKEAEKLLIKKALIHTSENRTQAAKILGVSIRTLRNKINEYRNGGSAYFVNLR